MYTTFTLPKEYDDLPDITRLWLQSRMLDDADETSFVAKIGRWTGLNPSVEVKEMPVRRRTRSAISVTRRDNGAVSEKPEGAVSGAKLRLLDTCQYRPLSIANAAIALDIAIALVPRISVLLKPEYAHLRGMLAVQMLSWLFGGVSDTIRIWTEGHLMRTMETGIISNSEVSFSQALVSAAIGVSFSVLQGAATNYFGQNQRVLESHWLYYLKKTYFGLQVYETVAQMDDPVHAAVMEEAAVLTGTAYIKHPQGHSFSQPLMDKVGVIGELLRQLIKIASLAFLVLHTLRAAGTSGGILGIATVVLTPLVVRMWKQIFHHLKHANRRSFRKRNIFGNPVEELERVAKEKQEVIFFGLGKWIMARWEAAQLQLLNDRSTEEGQGHGLFEGRNVELLLNGVTQVLVATKVVKMSHSLSTLTVNNLAISQLYEGVFNLFKLLETTRQSMYWSAAFCSAIDQERDEHHNTIDYEKRREEGQGMRLVARGLSVTYHSKEGDTVAAVRDVNLTVEPGETLALVGFNGSGKTTLAKALLGMVAHDGVLLVNGIPQSDYDPRTLLARMTAIFQDFSKYRLTLRDNIGIGNTSRINDDIAILKATARANGQVVVEKAESLNTVLNPWGVGRFTRDGPKTLSLSGGEWQRIALARAFMRADSADLVVFDEPSSALDPQAEAELFDTIYSLSHGEGQHSTTIFISHGFGNVRRADKIAFMEKGKIIEYGTHQELMALGGQYHRLFSLQSRGFVDAPVDANTTDEPSAMRTTITMTQEPTAEISTPGDRGREPPASYK